MQMLFDISQIFLATFSMALIMPIFWIVLFLVFLQYRRQAATEEKLYGRVIHPVYRQMLVSLGLGAFGGFSASVALVFLGLSLEQIGLYFIWPVALFLLLINPRYLCFSYAGGIVAAVVLLVRHIVVPLIPSLGQLTVIDSLLKIHIPSLLVLIGLLHLVEAMLIYISGHWGSSPIYLKQDNGKVIGAYALQRFWPLPLVALLVSVVPQAEIVGVSMPEWWPILQSAVQPGEGQSLQYMIIPVAAGLGYADMALSASPREKSLFSARWLALYSIILLIVAVFSEYIPLLILPGVIFAPLGHEMLILYGKKKEENEKPCYLSDGNGVQLLMILPGTAADEAGLKTDDLITRVNAEEISDCLEMQQKIEESYFMVLLEGLRNGESFSVVLKKRFTESMVSNEMFPDRLNKNNPYFLLHRGAALGFIPVPSTDSPVYLEVKKPDPRGRFKRLAERIGKPFKK
ncbi:MAG: PDZ domain-containing protein [Bacillota bacterium]|nr:PDZ domain-containing protein [Bacillota bacterium]